jgi:cation:H+ antiporter
LVWLKFAACTAIILFSGTKLAQYGDAIAEKTGLGRLWIGIMLIAAITSIPEVASGVSAASLMKSSDLAVGDILGSCLYNLTILAVLDILHRQGPILSRASSRHMPSAGMSIMLISVAALAMWVSPSFPELNLGRISIFSIVILVLYLGSIW